MADRSMPGRATPIKPEQTNPAPEEPSEFDYDRALQEIKALRSIDEATVLLDRTDAVRAHARQAGNQELEHRATEIRVHAERRLGAFLLNKITCNTKHARGRGNHMNDHTIPAPADSGGTPDRGFNYDRALQAVKELRSIDEAAELLNQIAAARAYARQARDRELEGKALLIQLQAKRRLGELLEAHARHDGQRGAEPEIVARNSVIREQIQAGRTPEEIAAEHGITPERVRQVLEEPEPETLPPTLAELGITRKDAAEARKHAAIPEPEHARRIEAVKEQLDRGADTPSYSMFVLEERSRRARTAAPKQTPPGFGADKFRTIVSDPPWKIGGNVPYELLTVEQIKGEHVPPHAATATLHLWSTQKMVPEALGILRAWGAEFMDVVIWKKPGGKKIWDLPQYNLEPVLVARWGGAKTPNTPAWIEGPQGEHSSKPDAFYEALRQASPGPRIDIFARRHRPGYWVWGDQAPGSGYEPPEDYDEALDGDLRMMEAVGPDPGLQLYRTAQTALDRCLTVDEVRKKLAQAERIREYARRANDRSMVAMCITVRLRAMRRLGEILIETGRKPGRPKKKVVEGNSFPSLKDLGISKDLASKCKTYAKWHLADFEQALADLEAGNAAGTHRPTTDLLKFKLDAEPEPDAPEGTYETVIVDPDWTSSETIPAPPIWRDGCHVFLWTKPWNLPLALATVATWGAKYSCLFVWKPTGADRI